MPIIYFKFLNFRRLFGMDTVTRDRPGINFARITRGTRDQLCTHYPCNTRPTLHTLPVEHETNSAHITRATRDQLCTHYSWNTRPTLHTITCCAKSLYRPLSCLHFVILILLPILEFFLTRLVMLPYGPDSILPNYLPAC